MRNGTEKDRPTPQPRGRPRSFDEAEVLERVRAVFLEKGFSGASLDELAAAAKLARPSLYAAFGDKEGLYLHTLDRYGAQSVAAMEEIFAHKLPIAHRLGQIYKAAIGIYTAMPSAPGCLIVNTAAVEAPTHPRIGAAAAKLIADIQGAFERAFERAVAEGELEPQPAPAARARIAAGMLDTLALRARLGESAADLRAFARTMVPGICAGGARSTD